MKTRIALVAAGTGLAGFALWHPLSKPALTAAPSALQPSATSTRHRHRMASQANTAVDVVYVAGAVQRPGLYRVTSGARVDDAVRAAGGLRPDADALAVNLAARTEDGEEIAVPVLGDAGTPRGLHTRTARGRRARSRKAAPHVVDLNSVDASELASIPGIGPAIAARIVAVRERDGAFATLDQLLDVAGMTSGRLDRAQRYLRI